MSYRVINDDTQEICVVLGEDDLDLAIKMAERFAADDGYRVKYSVVQVVLVHETAKREA